MNKKRFKQLWKALVTDAPKSKINKEDVIWPPDRCSERLKKALHDAEKSGECLADNVRTEGSNLSREQRQKKEDDFMKRIDKNPDNLGLNPKLWF